jgi:hypothetical protein
MAGIAITTPGRGLTKSPHARLGDRRSSTGRAGEAALRCIQNERRCLGSRWCRSAHRMVWRNLRGGTLRDRQDVQRSTNCAGRQFHIRGWDDVEHDRITSSHGRRGQWIVGGVHHERIIVRRRGSHSTVTHKIDRDWDGVHHQAVLAMKRHCSYRRWRNHPGARRRYQGYRNSGWLARIFDATRIKRLPWRVNAAGDCRPGLPRWSHVGWADEAPPVSQEGDRPSTEPWAN